MKMFNLALLGLLIFTEQAVAVLMDEPRTTRAVDTLLHHMNYRPDGLVPTQSAVVSFSMNLHFVLRQPTQPA